MIVYKWDVLDIQEIEYPGEIDRCWFCGNKIPSGRFCEPRHEYVFRRMDLDKEMLEPNDGYRGRWTRRDSLLDFERLFDIKTLGYELKKTKAKTRDKFGAKIDLISQIIRLQTRLSGIYTQQCMTKEEIGLGSNENYVLRNTIGNQPYRSLSALMLIRNTFYGSARPIIRQFFESLMIAKYAEYDPAVATRWHDQDESKPESQVNLSDVLRPLNKIGKKNTRLRETWRVLCAMTHATRVSQQVLRLPDPAKPEDVTKLLDTSQYFENTEYSLDLLFLVLATNFHLITVFLAKKAEGWWFGDRQDAYGSFKREKTLTKSINSLIQQYLDDTMLNLPVYQMLRENLDEFEVSWNR